jgi:FKBP-type peptidyl-prolyl cis-trans isomerase
MNLKYMMNSLKQIVYFMPLLALLASCAKEASENSDALEQRYIEAYVNMNADKYPNMTLSESGLYFLESDVTNASGNVPGANDMIYIRYTSRTLAGNISETSVDSIAVMLGTHSYKTYYGPKLFSVAEGATLEGLREAFLKMRPGEKARILLPSKLSSTGLSDARLYSVPMLYDLELLRVVPDIATFQSDSLEAYRDKYYPGIDALADTLKDLYFVKLSSPASVTGELPADGDTVNVRYVGYLLDGFVFDTNIREVADTCYKKDFDKTATYDALTVMMKDDVSEMDVVQGFAYALKKMEEGEEAVVFFSSDYGYQTTTSGEIQPYSMLRFYIKVEHVGKVAE